MINCFHLPLRLIITGEEKKFHFAALSAQIMRSNFNEMQMNGEKFQNAWSEHCDIVNDVAYIQGGISSLLSYLLHSASEKEENKITHSNLHYTHCRRVSARSCNKMMKTVYELVCVCMCACVKNVLHVVIFKRFFIVMCCCCCFCAKKKK